MSRRLKQFGALAVVATMLLSVVAAGGVLGGANINSLTTSVTPDTAGASSNVNVTIEYGTSNTVKDIVLDYPDGTMDVQSVGPDDMTIMYGGSELALSDVSGSGTSKLTITLSSATTVSSGETFEISSSGEAFVNPDNSGTYDLNVSISDGTSTWANQTTQFAIGSATVDDAAGATLKDKTVSVDSDTSSAYLEVTNTSGQDLYYQVYGVDSEGITTQETSGTISATANNTTRKEFAVDSMTYDDYRFVVSEDGLDSDNETAESISIGTVVDTSASGDGGGLFSMGSGGLLGFGVVTPFTALIGILVLLAGVLVGAPEMISKKLN